MKCNKCPALRTEGYEYPEEYCYIGIDGCEFLDCKNCKIYKITKGETGEN